MPQVRRPVYLTFHGLGQPHEAAARDSLPYWLPIAQFKEFLSVIASRPWVRITFDDSYKSDVEAALPALLEAGLTARFFVLAGMLDHPGYLASSDVRTLAQAGMTIGSHGMYHRRLTELDDAALQLELAESRDRLSQVIGTAVTEFSCPFGSYNRRVLTRARKVGFHTIYTSDGGHAADDFWLRPRTSLRRHHSVEDIILQTDANLETAARVVRTAKLFIKRNR